MFQFKQKKARAMIALVILIGIIWTAGMMAETKRLETQVNPNLASTLGRLLKRLPQIWSLKREAKKLAATLAESAT